MAKMLNHMGLTVSQLERSLDFYCGKLGLPYPAEDQIFYIDGEWLANLVGFHDPRIRVAFIPLDHGVLELLEYERPSVGHSTATLSNWDVGAAHLALNHSDIHAFYAEHADDIDFFGPPQTVEGGPFDGAQVIYMKDPDGVSVELVQR